MPAKAAATQEPERLCPCSAAADLGQGIEMKVRTNGADAEIRTNDAGRPAPVLLSSVFSSPAEGVA
jgi:hypothetical protein